MRHPGRFTTVDSASPATQRDAARARAARLDTAVEPVWGTARTPAGRRRTLRLTAALVGLILATGCEDSDRGGLGPRGTALPPPDFVPESVTPAPQAAPPPARRAR